MALGRKLDRKCQRVCSIAAPASIPGRETLRAQELPAAKDDVTALPSTPRRESARQPAGGSTQRLHRLRFFIDRSCRRFLPLEIAATAVVPGLTSSSLYQRLRNLMATDKAQDPWHGEAETLSLGDCLDREAETLRLSGTLKMNLSERSFSELPINPHVPAHPASSEAEHPGCVPTAAVPSQSSLPTLRCWEHGSARSRAGARRAGGTPQSSAPASSVGQVRARSTAGQHPQSRSHCPEATRQRRVVRGLSVPRFGARQQLFVRAADGSPERSRLFPAVAELTSSCSLSPWSIIVSSVITIALWCCIVLLPFGFRRNAAARLHSIYGHSSMQDLICCG